MFARFVSGRNLLPRGVCTQWKPVGNTLGGDENVGIHSVMLDSKHFPATRESGLHFVSDEQNAMLVENPFYFSKIVRRRNQNSPSPITGSAMNAATSPEVAKRITSSIARAHCRPHSSGSSGHCER